MAAASLLESNRRGKRFIHQPLPRTGVANRSDYEDIKRGADEQRQKNRSRKIPRRKTWPGFFRTFGDRFESGHEVRDDLEDQKHGYPWGVAEKREEIVGGPSARADEGKKRKQR